MAKIQEVNKSVLATIGDVVYSMLSEAQYQSLNGPNWILADGRNVAGSAYAVLKSVTTVPDLRGVGVRGKNNGRADGNQNPDGDLALGAFQDDMYEQHTHTVPNYAVADQAGSVASSTVPVGPLQPLSTNQAGGNETRMKNVTLNPFIKIN